MKSGIPSPLRRRTVPAVLSLFLIGLWVAALWEREGAARQWREVRGGGNDSVADSAFRPPNAAARVERAVVLSEGVFPPRREEALAELEAALTTAPMESRTWFLAARNHLFEGRGAEARAAMARSDALDPWYPGQRIRAVQFWTLLGDRERAAGVARSVSGLGPRHRAAMAGELLSMGFGLEEAWDLVITEDTLPAHGGRVLLAMEVEDAGALAALMEALPAHWYDDGDFRTLAFRRASRPLLPGVLRRLWEAGHGPLGGSETIPLENPSLDKPPFRPGLPLGWMAAPLRAGFQASWSDLPAAGAPEGSGVIRVEIPAGENSANWRILRTITAETEGAGRLFLNIRRLVGRNCSAWITARRRGESARSPAVELTEEWTRVALELPPGPPGFLDITLDLRAGAGRAPVVVLVGGAGVEGGGE